MQFVDGVLACFAGLHVQQQAAVSHQEVYGEVV
jgi:hypothetical protein